MSILKKPIAEQADAETTGERRQGDRRKGGDRRQPGREGEYQGEERRKLDRRGPEVLRSELQWRRAAEVHERGFKARSRRMLRGMIKRPSRILVLLMALGSGGIAALLTTQRDVQATQPVIQAAPQVIAAKTTQILVARSEIGIGEQISEKTVAWEDWPDASLRPEYITMTAAPKAIAEMSGSVARFEIFPGEPIRAQKLADASQGYLSAVLNAGMRAVSVSVAAESASGGFVNPNDHVDVVLTRKAAGRSSQDETAKAIRQSQTILHNVRVLAIDSRLGEMNAKGEVKKADVRRAENFTSLAIATLELDPTEAEVLINAATIGQLSLVLRSVTDYAENAPIEHRGSNQAIRISSPFWTN